jgi:lipopolysaccharide transport system ATP-binding protein
MTDTAILCDNLGKQYVIGKRQGSYKTLRDALAEAVASPFHKVQRLWHGEPTTLGGEKIWALKDVSFEIKHGDVVALIGRNGAGKSTLLKILSRITEPTCGFAETHGRVGSLLEVGTGFHPELTGRENTFLNGAILGMSKSEIRRKFDEIVAFSEIEKFIDTPVKHYSSGMYVRLAFAVAAHLDPEILILDEVLAVGDTAFQRKCVGKIDEVNRGGRTVLMVSHNITAAQSMCRRGLVLQAGGVVCNGSIKEAVDYYLNSVSGNGRGDRSYCVDLSSAPGRPGRFSPVLKRVELFEGNGTPLQGSLPMGAALKVHVFLQLEKPLSQLNACLGFNNLMGQRVFTAHTYFEPRRNWGEVVGDQCFVCTIPSLALVPGEYRLKVALSMGREDLDSVEDAACLEIADSDFYGTGKVPWNGTCVIPHRWRLIPGSPRSGDIGEGMVGTSTHRSEVFQSKEPQ